MGNLAGASIDAAFHSDGSHSSGPALQRPFGGANRGSTPRFHGDGRMTPSGRNRNPMLFSHSKHTPRGHNGMRRVASNPMMGGKFSFESVGSHSSGPNYGLHHHPARQHVRSDIHAEARLGTYPHHMHPPSVSSSAYPPSASSGLSVASSTPPNTRTFHGGSGDEQHPLSLHAHANEPTNGLFFNRGGTGNGSPSSHVRGARSEGNIDMRFRQPSPHAHAQHPRNNFPPNYAPRGAPPVHADPRAAPMRFQHTPIAQV